jgi:hypothetical protein
VDFASPVVVEEQLRYSPNPVTSWRIANLDSQYSSRLNGRIGEIPSGDPQVRKRTGWLPAQQAFVGAQQLLNLANAKVGLSTAIPATKPNPGVIPMTAMQSQLANLGTNGMR